MEHVRAFVAYAKQVLNKKGYYPPRGDYKTTVALALYSKCITVAEATLLLVDADFGDEAFGMTRTLLDIFFTLRYITNQDTDNRARMFWRFLAKDIEGWGIAIKQFWPHNVQHARSIPAHVLSAAATYKSPHRWSGRPIVDMALEPDTVEIDPATGRPLVYDFAYRVIYRWTSHYVHPTIAALENHIVQAGRDVFAVRTGNLKDMRPLATYNVGCYVAHTMVYFYRCMGDPQPARLGTWGNALVKHLTYRHLR